MSTCRVWLAVLSAGLLIWSPFSFQQVLAQQQSTDDLVREACKSDDLKKALLDKVEASRGKGERAIIAFEIDEGCAVYGMPAAPKNDTVDTGADASHTDEVHDARYSADGKTILSASQDGTLRLWNAQSGEPIRKIDIPGASPAAKDSVKFAVRDAAFIGDVSKIAVSNGASPVRLLEVASGNVIADIPFPGGPGGAYNAPRIVVTAKGLLFIAGRSADVVAYDTASNAVRYRLGGHSEREANPVAISDAVGLLATGTKLVRQTPLVRLWKLDSGEQSGEISDAGTRSPNAMAFSRDGKQLAVAYGGTVIVYDVANKRAVQQVITHPIYDTFALAFTADGKGLLTCRAYPVLWDIASGKAVRRFGPFTDLCHSVNVSPDGKYAVTTSLGSDVRIWDISTGVFFRRLGQNTKTQR
jgi:WD40 repeat protein